jgi:polyisoprenoid-binding protein YceI
LTGVTRFGPDTGSLEVHTYREGVAAKVGHDLIIEVESWEGSDEGGTLELTADPRSLRVREGHRGVKPLTDKDRDEIRKTIEAKVLGTQPIAFRSTLVADDAVEGELTIAGATRPVAFRLEREGDRVRATVRVVQSQWGIKPYRGLMGALKVRDDVDVVLDAPG